MLELPLMTPLKMIFAALSFIFFTSFAHAAIQFDSDVPTDLKKQILDDFSFVQSIKSDSATPMYKKVFGNLDGAKLYQWLNDRVEGVGVDDCGNPLAVACVIRFIPNKIWMTPNYSKFSHPQIARLAVVYHEARHTEVEHDHWGHATCPTPFKNEQGQDMRSIWTGALLQGEPACDITPYGSYGSSTIMLKNIGKYCESCTEKVRADADLYGTDQLGRIIDATVKKSMINDFASKNAN